MGCAESTEADHPSHSTAAAKKQRAARRYTVTPETDDDEGYSVGAAGSLESPSLTPEEAAVDLQAARPAAPCLRKASRTLARATCPGTRREGSDILPPPGTRASDGNPPPPTRRDSAAAAAGAGGSSSGPRVRFEQLGESHGGCPAAAGLPTLPSDGSIEGSRQSATMPPVMFAWDIPSASGSETSSKHAIDSSVDGLKVSTSTGRRRRQRGPAHLPTGDGSSPSPQDTPLAPICDMPATDNLKRLLQQQ